MPPPNLASKLGFSLFGLSTLLLMLPLPLAGDIAGGCSRVEATVAVAGEGTAAAAAAATAGC